MDKFLNLLKANKNDIIKPIVVLLAICVVIPLALSLTNKLTTDRIAKLQAENEKATMANLIEADTFNQREVKVGDELLEFHEATLKEETKGYIFVTSAKGYGGTVSVMTAINTDGTVSNIAILDAANETPGLGQNVTKEKFHSQFSGKKSGISVLKNGAKKENNEINAVTGATISSTAVTNAVNDALEAFNKIVNQPMLLPELEVADNGK